MARASNLTMCSFCGKSHAEVRKLIAGPGVYICDSCINVCKSILDKELNEDARRQSSNIRVPKPAQIREALDQYVIGQESAKKTLSVAVHNHFTIASECRLRCEACGDRDCLYRRDRQDRPQD